MRENLTRFLVERLLDLDPTLPDTEGSVVYTKVINPLLARLGTDPMSVDIERFILSRLKAEFPQIDYASPGSVLRDLVVSPLVLLLDPLKSEVEFARRQNSLANAASLTDEEMDALLSNLFATRSTGSYAFVTVRVYFSTPRAFSVDSSIVFSTAQGQSFVPQESTNYLSSDFTRFGNLFYVDIPLRSSTQTETANVAANTIKFVNALDGVVRLTNPSASSGGVTRESNEQFLVRAERSLSERSLNTKRGIETNIRNNFSDIVSLDTIGYGDPAMQRDVLQGEVRLPGGPGPLLVTTNKFKTLALPNWGNLPITNQVSIRKDRAGDAAKVGNFVRISDGEGDFDATALSRPRRIVEVVEDPADGDFYRLTLADFEHYTPLPLVVSAVDPRVGYNHHARQGSSFRLIADNTVLSVTTTYVRGAPLPFDEWVPLTNPAGAPTTVRPGQDFLMVVSPDEAGERYVRCYPIFSRKSDGLTLSRQDSFLTSKNRIPYQGQASFTYRAGPDVTLFQDGVQVVAFGGPALSQTGTPRYDGLTKEVWGTSAGVRLVKPSGSPLATDTCTVSLMAGNGGWATRGIQQGHYISLARFADQIGAPPAEYDGRLDDASSQLEWHSWGRIESISQDDLTLTVSGLDWQQDPEANQSDYRLFWTVYVGEVEAINPLGEKVLSYADQVFAPAYRAPAQDVHAPFPAPFRDAGFFDGESAIALATPWGNTYTAVWVRTERPFFEVDPGMGAAPAQRLLSALVTDLNKPAATPTDRKLVSRVRYRRGLLSATVPPVITQLALPYVEGAQTLSRTVFATTPTDPPLTAPVTPPSAANPQDATGYLLCAGLGSYTASADQFLQIFGAVETQQLLNDVSIVVSGIPGSLPLTGLLPRPVEVQSDQVHVGGMTDIYVKAAVSAGESTGALILSPRSVSMGPDEEVLFAGTDGTIDPADTTIFYSARLLAAITQTFGIGVSRPFSNLDDLVLEILDPPNPNLSPKVVRILHNIADGVGGVRVDGSFTPSNAVMNGLRWRVLRSATIDLGDPLIVYQQGSDLITIANDAAVQCPSGFSFTADPTAVSLFLSIDAGPDRGEYRILSRTLNVLQLDQVVNVTAAGLPYRVYARQVGAAALPVVRVARVALAGAQEGVTIPYRHPVDIAASTFSGLNDDPVSGTGTLYTQGGRQYLRDDQVFLDNNFNTFDVVRLDNLDDPDRYFSVTSRVAVVVGPDTYYDLELDRLLVSPPSGGVRYTVGHPAVGTASMVFMQPTFMEVIPSTTLSFVDESGRTVRFRPSLAESSLIHRADDTFSDLIPGQDGGDWVYLTSASINLLGLGVRAGDEVRVLTKVLRSSAIAADQNLPLVGKILVLVVEGVRYAIILSGGNTTTLSAIANDIQAQTGGLVRGEVVTVAGSPVTYRLDLLSRRTVTITDEGTPGLLASLGLNLGVMTNAVPQEHVVEAVELVGNQVRLRLPTADQLTGVTADDTLFVDVVRNGVQRVYPADMVRRADGLYEAPIKLTSYDPFLVDQALQSRQLTATGYRSFGYDLAVDNRQYSYSVAEKVLLRVTSVMLDAAARTVEDAIPLAGASVIVSYDRSPAVADIQSYVLQPEVRVVNNNPLVRHFLPAYPVMSVQYRGAVTPTELTTKVSQFLASLYPNRPLEVFDLTTVLERAGATYVAFPQEVAFLTHDENRVIRLVRSEDVLTLNRQYHIMEIVDDLVTFTAV